MGSGIAQVFATCNFKTILFDVNAQMLSKAKQKIEKYAFEAISHIKFTSHISDCIANVVIEAVIEDKKIKTELFNKLIEINSSDTIFTTNTSSLSISSLAESISSSSQFAGLHFFNPAPLMKLVEVVKTSQTAEEVITFLVSLAKQIQKTPVVCVDSPGFIVNRVARPFYLEALYLHEATGISPETIDTLMESSGFKMGPFRLMDLIGNDVNFAVSRIVHDSLGSPARLAPSPVQQEMVKKGMLGRKSGKGYYEYPGT